MSENIIDIHKNDRVYDMIAEGEVANILAHYDSDYIMNIIKDNIQNNKNSYNFNSLSANPNIVYSFELNFNDLMDRYPSDKDNILQVRNERYQEIVDYICSAFNLSYTAPEETDVYTSAYNLYEFLVSGYSRNVSTFFSNFIYKNRESIYEALDLQKYKKEKNSSVLYMKKVNSEDSKIGTILSRIKDIVYFISGMDIDLFTFLSYCYTIETAQFINSIIVPNGNIFKDIFNITNCPELISEIRLSMQSIIM